MAENWAQAYGRIKAEVERDMPDADDADQFEEYVIRCNEWKRERGIK